LEELEAEANFMVVQTVPKRWEATLRMWVVVVYDPQTSDSRPLYVCASTPINGGAAPWRIPPVPVFYFDVERRVPVQFLAPANLRMPPPSLEYPDGLSDTQAHLIFCGPPIDPARFAEVSRIADFFIRGKAAVRTLFTMFPGLNSIGTLAYPRIAALMITSFRLANLNQGQEWSAGWKASLRDLHAEFDGDRLRVIEQFGIDLSPIMPRFFSPLLHEERNMEPEAFEKRKSFRLGVPASVHPDYKKTHARAIADNGVERMAADLRGQVQERDKEIGLKNREIRELKAALRNARGEIVQLKKAGHGFYLEVSKECGPRAFHCPPEFEVKRMARRPTVAKKEPFVVFDEDEVIPDEEEEVEVPPPPARVTAPQRRVPAADFDVDHTRPGHPIAVRQLFGRTVAPPKRAAAAPTFDEGTEEEDGFVARPTPVFTGIRRARRSLGDHTEEEDPDEVGGEALRHKRIRQGKYTKRKVKPPDPPEGFFDKAE
jgi:hypothetical protein